MSSDVNMTNDSSQESPHSVPRWSVAEGEICTYCGNDKTVPCPVCEFVSVVCENILHFSVAVIDDSFSSWHSE